MSVRVTEKRIIGLKMRVMRKSSGNRRSQSQGYQIE